MNAYSGDHGAAPRGKANMQRRARLEALTSEDVAQALVYAFAQPGHVNAQEILVMPARQILP
jgi:NADP-dependent 3-hydroxy acid dehydrogenase YdfG